MLIRYVIILCLLFQTSVPVFAGSNPKITENLEVESITKSISIDSPDSITQAMDGVRWLNPEKVLVITPDKSNSTGNEIEQALEASGIKAVRQNIEDVLAQAEKNKAFKSASMLNQFKNWWRSKYTPATTQEIHYGIISGGTRGALSAVIWFSAGLDPITAATLSVGQALIDFANTAYFRTVDNIMANRTNAETEALIQSGLEIKRTWRELGNRLLYSAVATYLWRGISGPTNTAHSITTLQGNVEVLSNTISRGFAGSYLGGQKATLSRRSAGIIGFMAFLLGTVFSTIDLAGIDFHSWTFQIPFINADLVIKGSTLAIIAYYTGAGYAIKKWPQVFERFADSVKIFDYLSDAPTLSCATVF